MEMREISIDGLEKLASSQNGKVYRLNDEQIVKVFNPRTTSLEMIRREKEAAKRVFVHGIPTAISYDIVKVGDRYGIVYELINAKTMGEMLQEQPGRLEEYAIRMAKMLKHLHSKRFEGGELPDGRLNLHIWADIAEQSGYYPVETVDGLRSLIDSIPPRDTFVHGDYNPGNILIADDEFVLIDLGSASVGHPVIDLISTYQLMMIVAEQPDGAEKNMNISGKQAKKMWDYFIREYLGTEDAKEIEEAEETLRFYVLIRGLAGVAITTMIDEEQKEEYAKRLNDMFLKGINHFRLNPLVSGTDSYHLMTRN